MMIWGLDHPPTARNHSSTIYSTGKTLVYGAVLWMEYLRLKRHYANGRGTDVQAYPSIAIMPPGLIVQTFNELRTFFPYLDIHVW